MHCNFNGGADSHGDLGFTLVRFYCAKNKNVISCFPIFGEQNIVPKKNKPVGVYSSKYISEQQLSNFLYTSTCAIDF